MVVTALSPCNSATEARRETSDMALPDPPYDAQRVRQRHHDHVLAVTAPAVMGAAVTLQVVGLTSGNEVIEAGLASILWVAAILRTMALFGTSMVRCPERHPCRTEGAPE